MDYQDSTGLVDITDILSNVVDALQHFVCSNDSFWSSNLEMVTGKLPLDMTRKWFWKIEKPRNSLKPPSLTDLNTWLQGQAIVHERLLSSLKT